MSGNSRRIPQFLKATSPQGLVRLMLSNNVRLGMQFEYQIVHDGKAWFAWFYYLQPMTEAITDAVSSSNAR